jgi:hypothetical protein
MVYCSIEEITDRALTPTLAEVWITAVSQDLLGDQEMRGRLIGPQCHYASTVEVAYQVQPQPRQPDKPTAITGRVVIPEPSLWEPETPFLYRGPVTVWKQQQKWFETTISHGLRRFTISAEGARLNGKLFQIRGASCNSLNTNTAVEFRQSGINTLLVPVQSDTVAIWEMADRLGFFILGQCIDEKPVWAQVQALPFHPSCLGWLVPSSAIPTQGPLLKKRGHLLGVDAARDSSQAAIAEVDIILREALLSVPGGTTIGHVDQG